MNDFLDNDPASIAIGDLPPRARRLDPTDLEDVFGGCILFGVACVPASQGGNSCDDCCEGLACESASLGPMCK